MGISSLAVYPTFIVKFLFAAYKENANFGVSEFSDFYAMRNRLVVTKKFYPYYLPSVVVGLCFSALTRVGRKEYMKALNIIKILFGKRDYK